MSEANEIRSEWRFMGLSALLLISLMYSTSLHLFFGPEPTLSTRYWMLPPKSGVVQDTMERLKYPVADAGVLGDALRERKVGYPKELLTRPRHRHKIATLYGDMSRYMAQVENPKLSRPPFKYRILPTVIVRGVRALTGNRAFTANVFLWLNLGCVLAAGLWLIRFLRRSMRFAPPWALLGGVLFVTMVQVTATAPFAMMEPASLLAVLPLFVFAHARKPIAFVISAVIAVTVKEVLIVGALLWLATQVRLDERRARVWLGWLLVSAAPIITFALVRVALGGSATEVGHGIDLIEGEGPGYLSRRFSSFKAADEAMWSLLLGFGALWLGVVGAWREPFLRRSLWIVPCVVLAALGLSGFVGRVVGVVYPVLIPGVLLLLQRTLNGDPTAQVSPVGTETIAA